MTDLLTDEAVNWIQSRDSSPFFLYLPYTAIHLPLKEPPRWLRQVPKSITGDVARHYAASVIHLDHSVGRILDALDKKGVREKTLFVFTSDNGGSTVENNDLKYPDDNCPSGRLTGNNSPLRGQKGDVYEGGTRVPTIVSWPGQIKPRKIGTPVQIVDWMPTFCTLAGYEPDRDLKWDGVDLFGLLLANATLRDRDIYLAGPHWRASSLRSGTHKLVTRGKGDSLTAELFDIQSDPGEQHDLSDAQPEHVRELLVKLEEAAAADQVSVAQVAPQNDSLITAITKQTLWTNRDGKKQAWAWDDGTPLSMSTTQQHWLTHSDGLFLVYTRKDPSNKNVIRWRSPLWLAKVDTEKRCLIKSTERIALPLVGDGVDNPDNVALMGNFDVTNVSPTESWITVDEWMPRSGYRGDVLLARIHWSKPNRLSLW